MTESLTVLEKIDDVIQQLAWKIRHRGFCRDQICQALDPRKMPSQVRSALGMAGRVVQHCSEMGADNPGSLASARRSDQWGHTSYQDQWSQSALPSTVLPRQHSTVTGLASDASQLGKTDLSPPLSEKPLSMSHTFGYPITNRCSSRGALSASFVRPWSAGSRDRGRTVAPCNSA